jgi:multiple sugar transport system substrate-binding protein
MSKKVFFLVSMVVIASMMLVACGQTVTTAPTTAVVATKAPEATKAPVATVAPVVAGKTMVRWFIGMGTGTDPVQLKAELSVVDDFNKSQDKINLVLEVIPYDSAKDTLSTEIAAGNGPDIVGPVGWGGSNAFFGQWLDISQLMKDANYDTTWANPALIKMYETAQGTVGLPFAVFPSAIFFIPKLFDEAGLNYPPDAYGKKYVMADGSEVEWNWDTIAAIGKLLTIDAAGLNSTEAGFDKATIVQYGWTWQYENHPNYFGAFWANGAMLADGGTPGNYKAQAPDAWVAAWKWSYNAIWGDQPFYANAATEGSPEYANGNPFNSKKVAMTDQPLWYTCCMGDLKDDYAWEAAALPSYNGVVAGRIDADTFRVWKGTKAPAAAFQVLAYLVGPAVDKLIIGSEAMPPAYGAFPASTAAQTTWLDAKKVQFPKVKNWQVILDGLSYPDSPSAEGYMPNYNEAWNRGNTFASLMRNTGGLDLDKEIQTYLDDLTAVFNK